MPGMILSDCLHLVLMELMVRRREALQFTQTVQDWPASSSLAILPLPSSQVRVVLDLVASQDQSERGERRLTSTFWVCRWG